MAAYRASGHEATGYLHNMLTLGHEARAPVDIVYDASENEDTELTYQGYVTDVRERMTIAYEEIRSALRKAAKRNKRYYEVRVRPNTYSVRRLGILLQRSQVSRQTRQVGAKIQWAIPSDSGTFIRHRSHSERTKAQAVHYACGRSQEVFAYIIEVMAESRLRS